MSTQRQPPRHPSPDPWSDLDHRRVRLPGHRQPMRAPRRIASQRPAKPSHCSDEPSPAGPRSMPAALGRFHTRPALHTKAIASIAPVRAPQHPASAPPRDRNDAAAVGSDRVNRESPALPSNVGANRITTTIPWGIPCLSPSQNSADGIIPSSMKSIRIPFTGAPLGTCTFLRVSPRAMNGLGTRPRRWLTD